MATYDFENLLSDLESVIKANLNTKLAAIETEKADSISIPRVQDSAYFLQSLDEEAANFDPFIVYGVEDIETNGQDGFSSQQVSMSVVVVVADNGINNINKIMFRYSRALREIIEENYFIKAGAQKLRVESSVPVPFTTLDGSEQYKAIGILIDAIIG